MRRHLIIAFALISSSFTPFASAETSLEYRELVHNYTNIAHAVFDDSLITAKLLQSRIDKLIESPSEVTLASARDAWLAARIPYQQSEVFRFGHEVVDEWEGQLNAWPLDEGLLDYVSASYESELGNDAGTANIIANSVLDFGGEAIDLSVISADKLADLNELAGSEANVATGYHAIEFLLWGQDLNGTGAGAGERPYTDFVLGKQCTGGNCDRRATYLKESAALLVDDLAYMEWQWSAKQPDNYRQELLGMSGRIAVNKIMFGMGSLALGELAGERMKVALEANSPEDEHDCFSDNTHNAHYFDAKGIANIFYGRYERVDGQIVEGPSLQQLIETKSAALAKSADNAFSETEAALAAMVKSAESGMAFDQMIAEGNSEGAAVITRAVNALVAETKIIEEMAQALGLGALSPDSADHTF